MTRDAEHTPTGYEDAASVVVNQAPAPSSLASGAVSRAVACVGQVARGAQVSEVYGGEWCLDPALEFRAHLRAILAALSPEAPAREGVDLEGLLTTALTDELQGGGAEVPYSVIAERVAARVADEATAAPSCALTTAAKEVLSFLQNAPLESGICCCGDPISGHGYGSGHSPVDDLAYHSSQVAEKLQAALTPRHEAPVAPITEPNFALREACQRLIDDYQTSDNHHPNHVLVRIDHFQDVQAAVAMVTETKSALTHEAPAEGAGE